jgi:hypothetical protein
MSQHNRLGILTMTGAMVFFVVNDALVKWVRRRNSTVSSGPFSNKASYTWRASIVKRPCSYKVR